MNRYLMGMVLALLPLLTVAQEGHGGHAMHTPHAPAQDETVAEGAWAPTGVEISTAQRCALAARGVVMLDNAAWLACGGKPAEVPQSVVPSPVADHHHTGH